MDHKALKFYLLFFVLVCALTYFTYNWLVSILGSLAFAVPGVVAVAGFWISKKLFKSPA